MIKFLVSFVSFFGKVIAQETFLIEIINRIDILSAFIIWEPYWALKGLKLLATSKIETLGARRVQSQYIKKSANSSFIVREESKCMHIIEIAKCSCPYNVLEKKFRKNHSLNSSLRCELETDILKYCDSESPHPRSVLLALSASIVEIASSKWTHKIYADFRSQSVHMAHQKRTTYRNAIWAHEDCQLRCMEPCLSSDARVSFWWLYSSDLGTGWQISNQKTIW